MDRTSQALSKTIEKQENSQAHDIELEDETEQIHNYDHEKEIWLKT